MGTPGGLLESTRVMVQAIEDSPVPVIIFISPTGSRAGSAGFFLLEAADIAAMAPGTNAGAAHPIVEGRQLDPILKEKIENDAAAFLRSYASRRGRNVEAAEDAVRNSKSYSDEEALKLKLIDLVTADDASLLAALDGREIHRFDGTTADPASPGRRRSSPQHRRCASACSANSPTQTSPCFCWSSAGCSSTSSSTFPGPSSPASIGTLFVVLGLFGLNLLPVRHTAIVLLLAAFVLMLLEAKFTSHGVLALAGIASLVVGLATLVDGPIPELRVHTATALGAGLGFGTISFGLAWIALRARRSKVLTGPQAMIGGTAIVRTRSRPTGQVEIRGELWQASLRGQASLAPGSAVSVQRYRGSGPDRRADAGFDLTSPSAPPTPAPE